MTVAYYLSAATSSNFDDWRPGQRVLEEVHPHIPPLLESARARRDAEWVRRIGESDREAFSELYREYLESMVGFTFRIVRSQPVAEDLCADIFVALWQHRETWNPKYGARAYLFHAARMRALNYVRHHATVLASRDAVASQYRHTYDRNGGAHTIDDRLDFERKIASVREVLAAMPETRRRVMQLRWQEGFEIAEIAEVLGLSRAAVDQHLSRGLRTLRERLPELMLEK